VQIKQDVTEVALDTLHAKSVNEKMSLEFEKGLDKFEKMFTILNVFSVLTYIAFFQLPRSCRYLSLI